MTSEMNASLHPLAPGDDHLLTSKQVRARCGNVTTMCIWRWERDPKVGFPAPVVRINGRRYWTAAAVRGWVASQALRCGPAASVPVSGCISGDTATLPVTTSGKGA